MAVLRFQYRNRQFEAEYGEAGVATGTTLPEKWFLYSEDLEIREEVPKWILDGGGRDILLVEFFTALGRRDVEQMYAASGNPAPTTFTPAEGAEGASDGG